MLSNDRKSLTMPFTIIEATQAELEAVNSRHGLLTTKIDRTEAILRIHRKLVGKLEKDHAAVMDSMFKGLEDRIWQQNDELEKEFGAENVDKYREAVTKVVLGMTGADKGLKEAAEALNELNLTKRFRAIANAFRASRLDATDMEGVVKLKAIHSNLLQQGKLTRQIYEVKLADRQQEAKALKGKQRELETMLDNISHAEAEGMKTSRKEFVMDILGLIILVLTIGIFWAFQRSSGP